MGAQTLWERFAALAAPVDGLAAAALATEGSDSHLLIKGSSGAPVFLLRSAPRGMPRAPIRLKHIGVTFDEEFEVVIDSRGHPAVGRYTRLTCSPDSPRLHQWFVELVSVVAQRLPREMPSDDVDDVLGSLLELFREASTPSPETIVGLWGELLVLDMAEKTDEFVRAWRSSPRDGFDFDFGTHRLEVKTTRGSDREHRFSMKQAGAVRPTDFVASIVAASSVAGQGVLGMTRQIASKLPEAGREKLWFTVLETLGPELEHVDDERFDVASAKGSVEVVLASSIPAPVVERRYREVVRDVRFTVSLSHVAGRLPPKELGMVVV